MPLTLPPAQKAVPAPVIRSAPTSGFSPQVLIIVRNAGVKLSDRALRTSGRLSVMIATRSRIAHSNSLVPVSMVISVVVMSEFPPLSIDSVIASQRVGAKRRPMTGSAKQSNATLRKKLDCFVALLLGRKWDLG